MLENKSSLHQKVYQVLRELYPLCPITHEYPIRVDGRTLFIDMMIEYPYRIAIECQGSQHEEFSPFFHKTKLEFQNSLRRDRRKEEWCAQNYIPLVYVYEGEEITKELLKERIYEAEERVEILKEKDFPDEDWV